MNFIEWLKVILLGIVEGITEWLPISSTGHLILTDAIWPLQQSDAFKEMFNVVIQLGAILAVVVLYWSKLWPFHRKHIPQRSWFAQQSTNGFVGGLQRFGDRYCCMDKIVMWLKIAVSCLPAMLIGLPLNDWLDKHFYNPTVVALMLLLKVWQPKSIFRFEGEAPSNLEGQGYPLAVVLRAWAPYLVLAVFVFFWGLPQFKNILNAVPGANLSFGWPGLPGEVMKTAPIVARAVLGL